VRNHRHKRSDPGERAEGLTTVSLADLLQPRLSLRFGFRNDNSNQFQIVRRKDFPFRVLHFQSAHGFPGAFVQNLKTFLAAGEEITFSPLAQSNDNREQLSAFLC
jgi:hypothetical protein